MTPVRGTLLLALAAFLALVPLAASDARAHGGVYVPPPPDPPPPPPPDPLPPPAKPQPVPNPRAPEPTPPPSDPRPIPTPPSTGGGTPTPPPTGLPPPPRGAPTPPSSQPTPGSRPRRTGGVDVEDWSTWWYYSRARYFLRRERVASGGGLGVTTGPKAPLDPGEEEAAEDSWMGRSTAALRKVFPDPDTEIFTGCAVALGKAGDPLDAATLVELARGRYRNPTIRESLVLGLGLLGRESPGTREVLLEILRDRADTPRLRGFAAIALGLSGDAGAAPALLATAAERGAQKDPAVGALVGLGLLGEDLVVPDLVEMLGDASDSDARALRPFAAFALGRIGGPESVKALGRTLSDGDPQVRRASLLALGECDPADARALVPALSHAAREDRDRPSRSFAMLSLGRIGGPAAFETLARCFGLGDRGERNFAALALALYGRGLDDVEGRRRIASLLRGEFEGREDAGYRGALAISLGLLADARAVPALRAVVRDRGDPELRGHCALALGMIGAPEAAADLRAAALEKGSADLQREAALGLGLLGDGEAAGTLAALVGDSSSEYVRASAAQALGQLRGPRAAAALEGLLLDGKASGAARGQAAVGLGLLLDPRPLGAMASLSPGLNYLAPSPVLLEALTIP